MACGPDMDAVCDELLSETPSLEIGTGVNDFVEVDEVTFFERGPQGGLHIYASVRAYGLYGGRGNGINENTPLLTYTVMSDDGALTGGFAGLAKAMDTTRDGRVERIGDLAVLGTYDATAVEGVEVELYAELSDSCGRSASASARTRLEEGVPQ